MTGPDLASAAEHYADGFHSAEDLARLAGDRLSQRLARAPRCRVCEGPLLGRRADAETCSEQCRERRKKRRQRARDVPV